MTRKYLIDLAERVLATYFETFLGLLIAAWADVATIGLLSVAELAAVAALPAALAVAKGGVARFRGDRENPSLVAPPIRTTLEG
ncbi:MAG TPA: hypothetical protein VFK52_10730 [Nocardioidaceae bacterium]|nr:hypothetical protein [Nocardioidaceae bacterium]